MTFTLTLRLNYSTMETGNQVAAALHKVAEQITLYEGPDLMPADYGEFHIIGDAEGHPVGIWEVTV
jgi:hypothetical protein